MFYICSHIAEIGRGQDPTKKSFASTGGAVADGSPAASARGSGVTTPEALVSPDKGFGESWAGSRTGRVGGKGRQCGL